MGSRDDRVASFIRQANAEKIEISLYNGLSISLSPAWLTLQATLFLFASLICSCCAVSSYVWGSVSPYLTLPALVQPSATVTAVHAGPPIATAMPTSPPTAKSVVATQAAVAPLPTTTVTLGPPTLSPTSLSLEDVTSPSPVPSLTPASRLLASPTPLPTPVPFSPATPTNTPSSSSFSSDLRIAHVEPASFLLSLESDEHIVIQNGGIEDHDMTGWTVNNDRLDTYWFPAGFVLPAGASVHVWTSSGIDTEADLHWDTEKEVWSSDHGTAYLRDPAGTLVDLFHW